MLSDDFDISKLKVPELRAELGKRGLNTFGTRQVLMDRLSEVIGSSNTTMAKSANAESDEPPCITSPVTQKSGNQDSSNENSVRATSIENGSLDQNADSESKGQPDYKRKRSASRSPNRPHSRDRDSRRSPKRRSRSPQSKSASEEASGWENITSVFLDSYNSDLSLVIDADGFNAKPRTDYGFSSMWAGVRANYGLVSGKGFFEVRSVRYIPVENRDTLAGGSTHVLRVGWSTENSGFALGEEPQSYGYGGTGKKSCNNKFGDYGCSFGEGDVVGAFLEWTSTEAIMRFSVNGVDQGECYRVQKSSLGDRFALFPHMYVKNVEFSVNFGQDGQPPWFPPNIPHDNSMSWQLMNNVSASSKVRGRMPPASKAECEVVMMMGLPGAGKTYYAERMCSENPEKQYNILGTNLILDKMKVLGLARQRNYHGRWDLLIREATDCLNVLIALAAKRRRNYILDQTNVYPTAQRRKMRPFEGFKRKAIVIVPTDEEFRRRIAQREKEEGKEVPESAVLEMKANFGIPKPLSEDPSSFFDEVMFTELDAVAADELVQKYNEEGRAYTEKRVQPPPEKRQRWDGNRDRDSSDSRDSRFRGSYDNRDRDRDFNRGRRDDFRRSPNRRDDRGRRDYRGGYNAERDRSRDSDRYDRGRDQDSYGRPPSDRFGGQGSRFGAPGRGGFPPGAYGGGYGGARGGGMMRGSRGGPMNDGIGRGFGGSGFDRGAPTNFRGVGDSGPPRGRGGFRPGPVDPNTGYGGPGGSYGGPGDSLYSSSTSRFDTQPGKGPTDAYNAGGAPVADFQSPTEGTAAGGYRGGYGGPPGRGAYGAPTDPSGYGGGPTQTSGRSGMSGRGGRGGPPDRESSMGRGGSSVGRGGPFSHGAPGGRGGALGSGYQGDPDNAATGYQVGMSDRSQPFNSYSAGGPDAFDRNTSAYSGSQDYTDRSRDRYPGPGASSYMAQNQPPKSGSSGYPVSGPTGPTSGYQRTGPPSGYPGGGHTGYGGAGDEFSSAPGGYSASGGYPGPDSYMGGGVTARGGRPPTRGIGGHVPSDGSRSYSTGKDEKIASEVQQSDRQTTDAGSLYASGAARYETRSGAPQGSGPRQSRFDTKPDQSGQSYSNYPTGYSAYGGASAYGSGPVGGAPNVPPPSAPSGPGGPRSGRSRFDVGPGSNPSAPGATTGGTQAGQTQQMAPIQPPQGPTQTSQQGSQAYGYGYTSQSSKADPSSNQSTGAPAQSPYSSYGYGYTGYGGTYGSQSSQPPSNPSRPTAPSAAAPSLYASVVSDKPMQQTAPTAAPSSGSTQPTSIADPSSSAALTAAAYASYYGYGAGTPGAGTTTNPSMPSTTQPQSASVGKYDSSMTAAQQYSAWQQQSTASAVPTPATTVSISSAQAAAAAAAYASYYPGYSAYASSYGATNPMASNPAAPTPPTMPQYYGGYR